MNMHPLSRRLKKLERIVNTSASDFNFDELQRVALKKLSLPDGHLVREVLKGRDLPGFIEAHGIVWGRWGTALSETIDELRFPSKISAGDLLL